MPRILIIKPPNLKKLILLISALVAIISGLIGIVTGSITIIAHLRHTPPIQTHILIAKLQDFAPSCDTVGNPSWVIPDGAKSSTNVQCSIQGLEMVPSSTATLAEFDLDRINGQLYSQNDFKVKISVTFESKPDSNTMAGLVVQTPQEGVGGYGLAINNTGYWELVNNNKRREASGHLTTSQTVFGLELKVEGEKIYGSINNREQILMYNDTSNPSKGAIGLIIYGGKPPLASVYFSDFELDL